MYAYIKNKQWILFRFFKIKKVLQGYDRSISLVYVMTVLLHLLFSILIIVDRQKLTIIGE
jgi:hypothetical protein